MTSQPVSSSPDAPSRQSCWIAVALLGLLVLCTHWRPVMVWPLSGVWLSAGLVLVALLAAVIAIRARLCAAGLAAPAVALTLFAAWAWTRTACSTVPTDGAAAAGMLVMGIPMFWLGAFVVRVGVPAAKTSSQPSPSSRQTPPVRGRVPIAPPPGAGPCPEASSGLWLLTALFAFLALLFAAHGALEYHLLYPLKLAALREAGALDLQDYLDEGIAHALETRRVRSHFGNPNVLCGFLAMCLPMAVALAREGRRIAPPSRRPVVLMGAALYFALLLYTAYRTGSVGGAIVLFAGVALVLGAEWAARRQTRNKARLASLTQILALGAAMPVGIALLWGSAATSWTEAKPGPPAPLETHAEPAAPQENSPRGTLDVDSERGAGSRSLLSSLRQVETVHQRLLYWRTGWRMWRKAPFLGHGLGSYGRLYPSQRLPGAQETRYAHNFVIQLAVETGLVGLGLFLWFAGLLGHSLVRGIRGGRAQALWLGVGGALALFLLDSLGDLTFHNREIYLDFCLLAGAFRAAAPPPAVVPTRRWVMRRAPALTLGAGALVLTLAAWPAVVAPLMARHYLTQTADALREMHRTPPERQTERYRLLLEARSAADRARDWQPANPRAWQESAHIQALSGRGEAALADAGKARELHPLSASIRADLARYLWGLGRRDRALKSLDEAVSLNPLESTLHEQRARFLADLGRANEALDAARKAVRLAFTPLEKASSRRTLRALEARFGEKEQATPSGL